MKQSRIPALRAALQAESSAMKALQRTAAPPAGIKESRRKQRSTGAEIARAAAIEARAIAAGFPAAAEAAARAEQAADAAEADAAGERRLDDGSYAAPCNYYGGFLRTEAERALAEAQRAARSS